MAQALINVNLSSSQKAVMQQIINYGVKNGFSASDIVIAIKTAYIESSLGVNLGPPLPTPDNPNPTATGLFAYTDKNWDTYHSGDGEKNNFDNQIKAFYKDLATYKNWYYTPELSTNIPKDQIDFAEYVYIKHHDGRSTGVCKTGDCDNNGINDFLEAPGNKIWNDTKVKITIELGYDSISDLLSNYFTRGQQWRPPSREPLTLDLDGDGIETVGINTNNPILFDHDADGVKTATGWIKKKRSAFSHQLSA